MRQKMKLMSIMQTFGSETSDLEFDEATGEV